MLTTLLLATPLLVQAPVAQAPAAPVAPAAPGSVVQRVAVIGASLSQGFGLNAEVGAPATLADVIAVALRGEHQPVKGHASLLFFANPQGVARQEVEAARASEPTLLVALDFLFWFGYGRRADEAQRLASFEQGLELLAPFTCPILLGDLPDMHSALDGRPQMLQPEQVPSVEALAQLNQRLAAWARERKHVVLFPLGEFTQRVRGGQEFKLRGNLFFASELPELLQPDKLHPTLAGTIGVWIAAADALVRARPDVPADTFHWDRAELAKRLHAAKAEERQQRFRDKQREVEQATPPRKDPPPEPRVKG